MNSVSKILSVIATLLSIPEVNSVLSENFPTLTSFFDAFRLLIMLYFVTTGLRNNADLTGSNSNKQHNELPAGNINDTQLDNGEAQAEPDPIDNNDKNKETIVIIIKKS